MKALGREKECSDYKGRSFRKVRRKKHEKETQKNNTLILFCKWWGRKNLWQAFKAVIYCYLTTIRSIVAIPSASLSWPCLCRLTLTMSTWAGRESAILEADAMSEKACLLGPIKWHCLIDGTWSMSILSYLTVS